MYRLNYCNATTKPLLSAFPISEKKFREIIKHFVLDLTANRTAVLNELTCKTVNQIYLKIRVRLAKDCQRQSPFSGEVEVDESYFGARRVKGKRGRGAGSKTIVFGIYKRNGKVFTEIVKDAPLRINQAFRPQNSNKNGFPLNIDLLLDWLEISLFCDDFEEPEGAAFFACFDSQNGGTIQINNKYESLFEERPDVYLNCVGHEVGHAILRHLEHSSMNEDCPLFGVEGSKPPLLHKSSWHQYGLPASDVKKRRAQVEEKRDKWVKEALINSKARESLRQLNNKFELEWMFRQAEHFAKCLTIPYDRLFEVLEEKPLMSGWVSIYQLAKIFGVSATTMKLRLLKLKLIEIGKDGIPIPLNTNTQTSLF